MILIENPEKRVSLPPAQAKGCVYKSCPQRRQTHGRGNVPLFEVSIEDSAGEPFPADPDALQDPVTAQLMHDQVVVHHTWGSAGCGTLGTFLCLDGLRHHELLQ